MFWVYPHHYGWINPGFGFIGFLINIFFIILVISFIVSLFKSRNGNGDSETEEENAFDILKKRYAKGELTKRQFEDMKKDIR